MAIDTNTTRAGLTSVDMVLDAIHPYLFKWVENKVPLTKIIKETNERFKGEKKLLHKVLVKLPQGAKPTQMEVGTYPPPSSPAYLTFETTMKKIWMRVAMTYEAKEWGFGDPLRKDLKVPDYFRHVLELNVEATGLNMTALMMGNTDGLLATCTAASTTDYVFPVDYAGFFREGQQVTFVDSADNSIIADEVEILSVDGYGKEITIDSATMSAAAEALVDDTTEIYMQGAFSPSIEICPVGLMSHFSDTNTPYGTYQGKDRDDFPKLQALQHYGATPGTAEAFSQERLYDACSRMRSTWLGKIPTMGMCNDMVFKHIAGYLRENQMLTEIIPSKAGTPPSIQIVVLGETINIYPLQHTPANSIWLTADDAVVRYPGPSEWLMTGTGKISVMENSDEYQARWHAFFELLCRVPNALMNFHDVLETAYA